LQQLTQSPTIPVTSLKLCAKFPDRGRAGGNSGLDGHLLLGGQIGQPANFAFQVSMPVDGPSARLALRSSK
jgi:hypothetical protein